jgi:hypothetical protein
MEKSAILCWTKLVNAKFLSGRFFEQTDDYSCGSIAIFTGYFLLHQAAIEKPLNWTNDHENRARYAILQSILLNSEAHMEKEAKSLKWNVHSTDDRKPIITLNPEMKPYASEARAPKSNCLNKERNDSLESNPIHTVNSDSNLKPLIGQTLNLKPFIGQIFESAQNAKFCIDCYAKTQGFKVRIGKNDKKENKEKKEKKEKKEDKDDD